MKKMLPLFMLFLLLGGCGDAMELGTCRDLADEYMEKFAKGDYRGAYEMCDTDTLNYDDLTKTANAEENQELLNDYRGLQHGDGGQKRELENATQIRLAPAAPVGHDDYRVHFAFREIAGEWKIVAFVIEKQ